MGLHLHKLPVAVVLSLASTVAWASESTYQVTSKDQSVTKNNWIEYNDAEATGGAMDCSPRQQCDRCLESLHAPCGQRFCSVQRL